MKWTSGSEKRSARRTTPLHCVTKEALVFKASRYYERQVLLVACGIIVHKHCSTTVRAQKKKLRMEYVVFRCRVQTLCSVWADCVVQSENLTENEN